MGILRAGEKRYKNVADIKELKVSRIGWKRILNNTKRFAWDYIDEEDDGSIPPPTRVGKFKVSLDFLRIDKLKKILPRAVHVLEFFYNVVFLLRRIAAFLLPIFAVVGIVLSLIKPLDGVKTAAIFVFTDFAVWIACIITEGVLSRCAAAKIKNAGKSDVKGGKPAHTPSGELSRTKAEDDDDDVVTLTAANGEEIDLVEIAGIKYRGNFYAILQPIELLEGMEEDEALVFKVTRGADNEDKFEIVTDDNIIDAVFAEYNKLLDEAEEKGWKQ